MDDDKFQSWSRSVDPLAADVGGEDRAESIPRLANGFVAEHDATLAKQDLDLSA
jgi:hypothetical protein